MHAPLTSYERAKLVYESEPCARPFEEDLVAHLENPHACVFKRPDLFVMGRPVVSTAPHAQIVDPRHLFPSELCDCWHIYLYAGNMLRGLALVPYPLPLFSFERKNELRFYRACDIERLSKV